MNSSSSGRTPDRSWSGKGFYIVLFLCAAVIGVSAWLMATPLRSAKGTKNDTMVGHRVETVIAPAPAEDMLTESETEAPAIDISPLLESDSAAETPAAEAQEVMANAPSYVWPLQGEIDRAYSTAALQYDETLRDWRTHAALDIRCPVGADVAAVRAGTVASVTQDGLYGTMVTIDHGDGLQSVYANLADAPAVGPGDWVSAGESIGTVGSSAIAESAQESHLHFAMRSGGAAVDPSAFLGE